MKSTYDRFFRAAKWQPAVLLCFCVLLGILLSRHSFWRDEVQAWQIAVTSDSLQSMIHSLRYEGHPALWYLVLRSLNAILHSTNAMLIAHWLFASCNAFLIIWFCPFPAWQRIACCFGYFILFEYGLICRNYAMETTFALAFVAIYSSRKSAIWIQALALGLLVQTSVPGAMLAVCLLAYLVAEQWSRAHFSKVRLAATMMIVGVSMLAIFTYVLPPKDSLFAKFYSDSRRHPPLARLAANGRLFLRATIPIPEVGRSDFWDTNWTDSITPQSVRQAVQYGGAAVCLVLAALSMMHRRSLIVLFTLGTLMLAGFSIINGQTFMRHEGQWFILLLLCYWLDRAGRDTGDVSSRGWQSKIRRFFPAALFAVQPLAAFVPIVRSFTIPFSATPGLVRQVVDAHLDPSVWAVSSENFVAAVSVVSGHPVYSPEHDDLQRFSLWTDLKFRGPDQVAHQLAIQAEQPGSRVLLFTDEGRLPEILPRLPKDIRVTQVAMKPKGIAADEANVCLLLQRR